MVIKGPARRARDGRLETHRRHFDVHSLIAGEERIGWRAGQDLGPAAQGSDPDQDVSFHPDRPAAWTRLTPGTFAVYFPGEAHLPMVGEGVLHKVVVKIRLP